MGTVSALHGFLGGHVRKNRRHALHTRRKAHMKIPLIIRLEGLNSLCDGVLWELLEIGDPVRIHRPVCFETATLPCDKLLVALVGGGLHGVVNGEKSNSPVHQLAESLKVVATERGMASTAIAINHHGISPVENTNILWETVGHDRGLHKIRRAFLEALGQQHDASAVLVGQRPVASRAGNHHDLLGFGHRAKR